MFVSHVVLVAQQRAGDHVLRARRVSTGAWSALRLSVDQVMRELSLLDLAGAPDQTTLTLTVSVTALPLVTKAAAVNEQHLWDNADLVAEQDSAAASNQKAPQNQVVSLDVADYEEGGKHHG